MPYIGRPLAPSNLTATENGAGSLIIFWSLPTVVGVAVEFTLTAANLNNSSTGSIVSTTQDQRLVVALPDNTSCDVYSFQVTAGNAAGISTPSDSIIRSFPSLPDISPVEDSLQHSLTKTEQGVELTVTFNVRICHFSTCTMTV